MNDIKVKVNGDEAKCQLKDIGKTEVFGAEHKGAILKFEVPKVNPDIKLNMFVVPMNSKVEFRIVGEENKKTDNKNNTKEPNENSKKDRKSTRLNSSHANISYAVFCLKKK